MPGVMRPASITPWKAFLHRDSHASSIMPRCRMRRQPVVSIYVITYTAACQEKNRTNPKKRLCKPSHGSAHHLNTHKGGTPNKQSRQDQGFPGGRLDTTTYWPIYSQVCDILRESQSVLVFQGTVYWLNVVVLNHGLANTP